MIRQTTADDFLKDVAEHQMTVCLDSGVHRHLRFAKQGTSSRWFDIVTWPRFLTIAGDMGCWTFSRVPDMFNFFRSPKELSINPSYWSEKLQNGVHGGCDSCKVFDAELFGAELLEQVSHALDNEQLAEVTEDVKEAVFCHETQHELISAAADFHHIFADGSTFEFDTCELPDGKTYSYHFLWCLYAIVWGIQQWDALAV
jgi:hypothetical protein